MSTKRPFHARFWRVHMDEESGSVCWTFGLPLFEKGTHISLQAALVAMQKAIVLEIVIMWKSHCLLWQYLEIATALQYIYIYMFAFSATDCAFLKLCAEIRVRSNCCSRNAVWAFRANPSLWGAWKAGFVEFINTYTYTYTYTCTPTCICTLVYTYQGCQRAYQGL